MQKMPYDTHHKRMAALHYVSAYVSSDHRVEQMPFYTLHKQMAALQRVLAYVSPDQSDEQMPYYKHYWKLHTFRYMYQAVRSQ
jgi:hypothetical protein